MLKPTQDNLTQLERLENELSTALLTASHAISELSKDKPSVKQAETLSTNYLKSLEAVESGLSEHISYLTKVSTGQSHEGSSYASQKAYHLAMHRLKHAQLRLSDLEKLKNQHAQENKERFGAPIKTEPEG